MYAAAGESRKLTTPASSSGARKAPERDPRDGGLPDPAGIASTLGVATNPGMTTLQRIPRPAHSAASVRAMPTRPAFDAP